jgi:hypothetical protein
LNQRSANAQPGNESLTYYLDELSEQFYPAMESKVLPLQA